MILLSDSFLDRSSVFISRLARASSNFSSTSRLVLPLMVHLIIARTRILYS
jgi:hypothetical protein